jgi:8-oxo-dGTP pyrophosphatase MutT (NUDIX family)/GNAT superfamily N-acetyltransferase
LVYGRHVPEITRGDADGIDCDPHREPTGEVRAAVAARSPTDARERDSIAGFLTAFDGLDLPFDEGASLTHVTASAIVTSDAGVVLHLHKRLDLWLQPGGHIDHGEMPWDAARREALEETGLSVTPVGQPSRLAHVDVHPGPRGHTHLDLRYQFTAPPVVPEPPEGESPEVRWFSWAQAIAVADPGLEGALRVAQPGQPTLRPAVVADAAGCARVYVRSKAYAMPEVPEPHSEAEITVWIGEQAIPQMDVWVADVDGVVVGQMMLAPGCVYHLYIDPSWIGRGLGDQFMALARQRQPHGLQLWAFQSNAKARRFYERHGFAAVEFTDGQANDEHWPDVRYEG